MGKRGPKNTPTAIKRARGNPGQRTLPEHEPEFSAITGVDKPGELEGVASEIWDYYYPILSDARVLTAGDVLALVMLCKAADNVSVMEARRDEWRELPKDDCGIKDLYITESGQHKTNPFLREIEKGNAELLRLLREMGLTPSSRADIAALPPEKTGSEAAQLLGMG